MNEQVRTYLIEAARVPGKFVYYSDVVKDCNLNYDLSSKYGKKQLSDMLGLVSAYEDAEKRPLLSALAIYKDKNKNDHGPGFYHVAEKLGKGKSAHLKEELYGFMEAERCRDYWGQENNYFQFANTSSPVKVKERPQYFTSPEIDFFKVWQLKSYNPADKTHVAAKNQLMETVWKKSIYLCNEVVANLEGFGVNGKKVWSQRGWSNEDGINKQAATFKPYTWVKVFKVADNGKDIFFTFGIDAHPKTEAFVYKIDCRDTRDSKLNDAQKRLCKSMIPPSAHFNKIPFSELLQMDWEALIKVCVDFIKTHLKQYDAIIDAVWGNPIPAALFKNQLVKRDKPHDGYDTIPEVERKFKGVDVDYVSQAQKHKDLGDKGEELVKLWEIECLKRRGMLDKIPEVQIVKDGKGYDVFSYDENGNPKFIEVKTTTGSANMPFHLSDNEMDFMKLHSGQYCIYRVYSYNEENNFGEFFELNGDLENQLLFKPTAYKVYLKN